MDTLRANIINIYGESGKKWLLNLNQIVKNLQKYWNLKEIKAINNLTYNYVARASNDKNNPVILKIGCDKKIINDEINALKYFNNNGSIALLDYNQEYNALLLEQAIPGITLKSLYPQELDFVMDNFLLTISKLHDHSLPDNINFPSISSWLESIDKIQSNVIPKKLVDKAITLKAPLLSSIRNEKLLHGDLHLDNILKNDNEWLAIDPKGIIGDVEFEIAAFDFIANNELDDATSSMFKERIEKIANKAKLSSQRIKDWTFVRLILSAAWSIEDEGDPSKAIKLAQLIDAF
jgi:streptomycin 6-kinase